MFLYLPTSNQYRYLLEPFSILFNKYWPNKQPVKVLCYDPPTVTLPSNFDIISIGHSPKGPSSPWPPIESWSTALVTYFNTLLDEPFIINCEDMFLVDYVDPAKINKLYIEVKEKRADKAVLHLYGDRYSPVINQLGDFVELRQDALYRTSLHPAIWSKSYWLRHLKPNMDPWVFETQRAPENDGARIIFLREQKDPNCLFNTSNMCHHGTVQPTGYGLKGADLNGLVHKEDIEIVNKYRPS